MKLFNIPGDLSKLGARKLRRFIRETQDQANQVAANPAEFLAQGLSKQELRDQTADAVEAIKAAKELLAAKDAEPAAELEVEPEAEAADASDDEPEAEVAETDDDEELAAALGDLAAEAVGDGLVEVEPEPEPVAEVEEVVTAAAPPKRQLARPARSRQSTPVPEEHGIALIAAAPGPGVTVGETLSGDELALARLMIHARGRFGNHIPDGAQEKVSIARADWADGYEDARRLTADAGLNWSRIAPVIDQAGIRRELRRHAEEGLTASGGLCAPVTPYYGLQQVSAADRPVRASLPSFNADRGGINAARPAVLGDVTTAVDIKTADDDAIGGSTAAKTCQVVDCPTFEEVDVQMIYKCLQFGNLQQRTFPELVAQWNGLAMAAHARVAETALLDGIDGASTQVTAAATGGASAELPSQIIHAAVGIRSRHRMAPDTVLRVQLPWWVLEMLASDVYRSQFQRFDMNPDSFVALLRRHNVEPSFYLDGETGGGQVVGTQNAGALLGFPSTVKWYIYPEGSFLFLDNGVLDLGLVRDSVLNGTNDFQIFSETFENVAFIGVESLAVTSTVTDCGATSAAKSFTC